MLYKVDSALINSMRLRLRLSQQDFADHARIGFNTARKICRRDVQINQKTLDKLAAFFDVDGKSIAREASP